MYSFSTYFPPFRLYCSLSALRPLATVSLSANFYIILIVLFPRLKSRRKQFFRRITQTCFLLMLMILALLGRFPRVIPLFSLLLIVQFVLQYAFVRMSGQLGLFFIAAFHPVNAVVMFWVTQHVARRAMTYVASTKKQA